MKKTWILLALTGLVWPMSQTLAETVNPYEANYYAQHTGAVTVSGNTPTVLVGKDKEADNITMLEQGFDLLGSSSFQAGDVPPSLLSEHAKRIGAEQALVYVSKVSEKTAASRARELREIAKKNGGSVDDADIKTTAGTQYDYLATYWFKLPTPLLGLHVIKLKAGQGHADQEEAALLEKGLKVVAVIHDSPAHVAGLQRGDVILSVADTAVEQAEMLSKTVVAHQGETVKIAYVRNGMALQTTALLNTRR